MNRRQAKYAPVSTALRAVFGYPEWRPSLPPIDELVDCILSQSTNDRNRDRAFDGLKAVFPSWEAVMDAPTEAVIAAIKPAGLANQKAPRIQGVLRRIHAERGALDIDFLAELPLCFAFMRPAFPVDTHVHRVGMRIGFLPQGISADKAHPVMEQIVPPEDHYAFHLNLIRLGREVCQARRPRCEACPLTEHCDYFQAARA